jgi:hypothetical protein
MAVTLKRRRIIGKPTVDAKKVIKEGEGLIPGDAEPIDAETGLKAGDVPDDSEGSATEPTIQEPSGALLQTSLALVAPDCTPNWNVPLSPSLVPKANPVPAVPQNQPAAPQPDGSVEGPGYTQPKDRVLSIEGMLGLGRGSRTAPSNASAAAHLVSGIIQDSAPIAKSPEELLGQGKAMPDHVVSNSSSKLMSRFKFSE